MHHLTAIELRDKFIKGDLTATQITAHFLARIEKYNKQVGAFLTVFNEKAMKKAKELDEKRAVGKPLGKLAGIPIAIKDNIHVKGEISTCASKFLTNYRAPFEATVVNLIEDEDAIIIGKTNLDEFAMGSSTENSALQKTHNPWNLKRTPGGSSGGSAAAVAARLCLLALGSDTGGSIRQPAALCGLSASSLPMEAFHAMACGLWIITGSNRPARNQHSRHRPHDGSASVSIANTIPPASQLPPINMSFNKKHKGLKIGVPWQFLKDLAPEPAKIFNNAIKKSQRTWSRNCRYRPKHPKIFDCSLLHSCYSRSLHQPGPLRRHPLRHPLAASPDT